MRFKLLFQTLLLGTTMLVSSQLAAEDRAVIVGIDIYAHLKDQNLNQAAKDAIKFRNFVREDLGFREDQITLILDREATRERVIDALVRDLKFRTKPGDRLIFYFSGHGAQRADRTGDEDDGKDEFLVMADAGKPETFGILPDDDLRFIFEYFPDRRIMVVVDACYSGTISRTAIDQTGELARTLSFDPDTFPEFAGSDPAKPPQSLERSRSSTLIPGQAHMDVWSAASQTEVAYEDRRGGVFTRLFLEGAGGRADRNGNGRVSNAELLKYVRAGSAQFCAKSRGCQTKNRGRLTPEFGGMIEREAALRGDALNASVTSQAPSVPQASVAPAPSAPAAQTQPVSTAPTQAAPANSVAATDAQAATDTPIAAAPGGQPTTQTPPVPNPATAPAPGQSAATQIEPGEANPTVSAPDSETATTASAESAPDTPNPVSQPATTQEVTVEAPVGADVPTTSAQVEPSPTESAPTTTAPQVVAPPEPVVTTEGATPSTGSDQQLPSAQDATQTDTAENANSTPPDVTTTPPDLQTTDPSADTSPDLTADAAQPTTQPPTTLADLPADTTGFDPQTVPVPPALTCDRITSSGGTTLLEDLFLPADNQALQLMVDPGTRLRLHDTVQFDITASLRGQVVLFDLNPECQLFQVYPSLLSPGDAGRVDAFDRITIPSTLSSSGQVMQISVTEPTGRGHLVAVLLEDDLTAVSTMLPDNVELQPIDGGLDHLTDLADALNASFVDGDGRRTGRWHAEILPYNIVP